MKYRFFDIVVENENSEENLDKEFILDIPEYDMNSPVERMELLENMLNSVSAVSNCCVCSFRTEKVENFALVDC